MNKSRATWRLKITTNYKLFLFQTSLFCENFTNDHLSQKLFQIQKPKFKISNLNIHHRLLAPLTFASVNARPILRRPDVDAYYINIKIVFASRGARKEGRKEGEIARDRPFPRGRTPSIPSLCQWDNGTRTHNTRRFSAICGMVWPLLP